MMQTKLLLHLRLSEKMIIFTVFVFLRDILDADSFVNMITNIENALVLDAV